MNITSECPEVNFICTLMDFPTTTLRWFFNDVLIATYPFHPMDQYPRNLTSTFPIDGVEIQIISASLNSSGSVTSTSYLSSLRANISALQEARISSVSCGDFRKIFSFVIPSSILTVGM